MCIIIPVSTNPSHWLHRNLHLPLPPATHPHSPTAPQTHTSRAAGSCDHITFSSVLFAQCTQNKPKEFHNQLVFHMRKACFAWRDWSGLCIKFYTAVKVENMLKTCNKSFNRRTMKYFKALRRQEKKINCPFTMGKIIALLSQHVMKETEDEFVFSPCNLQ